MKPEKIRNLTEPELKHEERELNDQLFRLKFQMKMGQTESLKKIRDLRKDIARINTVQREKQLASGNGTPAATPVAKRQAKAKAPRKTVAKVKKPVAAKKAAKKKTAATETK